MKKTLPSTRRGSRTYRVLMALHGARAPEQDIVINPSLYYREAQSVLDRTEKMFGGKNVKVARNRTSITTPSGVIVYIVENKREEANEEA